jgi:hypothetical protein
MYEIYSRGGSEIRGCRSLKYSRKLKDLNSAIDDYSLLTISTH